jgi:purine-binding chemotaxis protein CheW
MTTQYCTFELGPLLLGVEARRVQEVLRTQPITRVPLAPPFIRGLMNLRGQIVLVIDLGRRLGTLETTPSPRPVNVLTHTSDGIVSLLADRIGDVIEVEPESFDDVPDTLQGPARDVVSGALRLPDRLLLLLNPERIAQPAQLAQESF